MIPVRVEKVIDLADFDELVRSTYGKPYSFQQQDDCKERQMVSISVPDQYAHDYENDTVPESVNHPEMGVSFAAWLARDPKQKLTDPDDQAEYCTIMWWERNFYPSVDVIINDLHAKGLLDAGEYKIDINW